jgi:hypothetical protein
MSYPFIFAINGIFSIICKAEQVYMSAV